MASNRIYLKGSQAQCEAYNDLVYSNEFQEIGTERWANLIERDGDFYILRHEDFEATEGLFESELPEIESEEI